MRQILIGDSRRIFKPNPLLEMTFPNMLLLEIGEEMGSENGFRDMDAIVSQPVTLSHPTNKALAAIVNKTLAFNSDQTTTSQTSTNTITPTSR